MTTTVIVPYADIDRMAAVFVSSGLFGIKKKDDAIALMLVAQAEGLHPASVAVDYDFIQGRPSKKPVAMLRDFIKGGGKVEWHELGDKAAEATFSHAQGGTVKVRWDMAKAQQAGLAGKDMWKKYPAAMLRSRVVSEGLRAVFPSATGGLYTPEEVQDMGPNLTANPRPENMVPMDPEQRDQYAQVVGELLDVDQSAMSKTDAANHCLKIRDLWDELDQDEQIQVNDCFNTKRKNRLKKVYALDKAMLKREAAVIEVQPEQSAGVAAAP